MKDLIHIEDKLDYLMEQVKRFHALLNAHEWVKVYYPWNCANDKMRKAQRHSAEDCQCPNVYNVKCLCGVELQSVDRAMFNAAEEDYSGVY